MPLYDYFCSDCGAFREMVRMADCALDQPCPSCGSQAQRMLSAPFFADSGDTADAPAQRATRLVAPHVRLRLPSLARLPAEARGPPRAGHVVFGITVIGW